MATSTRKRKSKASSKQEVTKQATVAEESATAPQAATVEHITKAARQTIAAQTTTEPKATMAEPPAMVSQTTVAEEPIMAPQAIRPTQRGHTNGNSPAREDIERRAYELFIARGAIHGNDLADWFRAEQEFGKQAGAEF
jgi:hypothetical protein